MRVGAIIKFKYNGEVISGNVRHLIESNEEIPTTQMVVRSGNAYYRVQKENIIK